MKLIASILLTAKIYAVSWVTAEYRDSPECLGPPQVIVKFNVSDISRSSPPKGEFWPVMYRAFAPITPLCGSAPLPLSEYCCSSILKGSSWEKYSQGFYSAVSTQSEDLVESIPTTFTLADYCQVTSNLTEAIYGYQSVYIQNNDICTERFLKCSQTGVFQFYREPNCQGDPYSYQLPTNGDILSTELGPIFGKFGPVIPKGKSIQWTEYQPVTVLVPNHSVPLEVIATILLSVSMLWCFSSTVYWVFKYRSRNYDTIAMFLACPTMALLYIVVKMIYTYYKFDSAEDIIIFQTLRDITFALSTFISAICTNLFLVKVARLPDKYARINYVLVVVIHVALMGGHYLTYLARYTLDDALARSIFEWQKWNILWLVLLFIWNLVPMLVVVWKLTEFGGPTLVGRVEAIIKADNLFFPALGFSVVFVIIYIISQCLLVLTVFLGNDRNFLALESIRSFTIAMNSLMNSILIDRVKVIFLKTKRDRDKYKMQLRLQRKEESLVQVSSPSTRKSAPKLYILS